MRDIPLRRVRWAEAHRIISARHPPIEIFEGVASAEDFDELLAVEEMTNARLRDAVGDLTRVPEDERVFGEGSSWIRHPTTDWLTWDNLRDAKTPLVELGSAVLLSQWDAPWDLQRARDPSLKSTPSGPQCA